LASETNVNLYGRIRTVVAYEHVVMLKTLKCAVKVVCICTKPLRGSCCIPNS
jgi:hypothetical protein